MHNRLAKRRRRIRESASMFETRRISLFWSGYRVFWQPYFSQFWLQENLMKIEIWPRNAESQNWNVTAKKRARIFLVWQTSGFFGFIFAHHLFSILKWTIERENFKLKIHMNPKGVRTSTQNTIFGWHLSGLPLYTRSLLAECRTKTDFPNEATLFSRNYRRMMRDN